MKLEVLQENLSRGVASVVRVVASRPQVPILANILLSARQGVLKLVASNMETTISVEVGAKIVDEGEFTVPGRTFSEIVSSLSAEKIVLEQSSGILEVKAGSFVGRINGVPAEEYPKLAEVGLGKDSSELTMEVAQVSMAISRVVIATAADESRAVLTGVLFKLVKDSLTLAATDGFRLSVVQVAKVKKGGKEVKETFIIPARALSELTRVIGESEKGERKGAGIRMVFGEDGNQVLFDLGDTKIYSRIISGNFPDFDKIIPSSFTIKVVLSVDELLKAVRLAAVFARDSANIVKFKIQNSKFKIMAVAAQVGENESELDCGFEKGASEELVIAFNFRYLMDFLSVAMEKEITAEFNGPLSPGVFKAKGQEGFLHIVMPVRVQS